LPIGSSVTGPVAPERGAGDFSEYDVETAIREAVRNIDSRKIILGIPLYGYEWESISGLPRSATIPSTGLSVSNKKAEDFLEKCASCEAKFDPVDKEMNVIYKDSATGFYHQLFYPEIQSVRSKIELAKKFKLGGVAFWALGYEGNTILQPLSEYIGK
jgi:spore germination protein YaaH